MSTLHVENLKGPTSGANANKIIVPSGQTLYPSGHIIQVLTQEITAYTTSSSASAVATGFTLTITPTSTSSLIRCTLGLNGVFCSATGATMSTYLYKNGSFLKYLDSVTGYASPSGQVHSSSNPTIMATDSPSTTSAVTYAIFWKRSSGSGNVIYNNYGTLNNETRSWYTVEEIAQ